EEVDKNEPQQLQEFLQWLTKNHPKTAYPPALSSLTHSARVFFRAYDQQKMIGVCGFEQKTPTLVETIKTVVIAAYRGKGYGKALSQAIEDECRSRGVKKIMSTIYTFNVE